MSLTSSSYMVAKHLPSVLSTRYFRRREGEAMWRGIVGVYFSSLKCLDFIVGWAEVFNVFVLKGFEQY